MTKIKNPILNPLIRNRNTKVPIHPCIGAGVFQVLKKIRVFQQFLIVKSILNDAVFNDRRGEEDVRSCWLRKSRKKVRWY